jgi:hypothetical protein
MDSAPVLIGERASATLTAVLVARPTGGIPERFAQRPRSLSLDGRRAPAADLVLRRGRPAALEGQRGRPPRTGGPTLGRR